MQKYFSLRGNCLNKSRNKIKYNDRIQPQYNTTLRTTQRTSERKSVSQKSIRDQFTKTALNSIYEI